ncbi:hypothetical protein GN958_ATG21987, partial [Phytophthora infestans]
IMESPQALARSEVPGDMKLNGIMTALKGVIEKQPRGEKIKKFSFTLEDGFQVLKTMLMVDSGTMLGPIAFNHVVTTHARQPDHTEFTLPDDNTTRQAIALDDAAAQLAAEVPGKRPAQVATIRHEINGIWNNLRVDITSLRAALGLPAHDIFTQ